MLTLQDMQIAQARLEGATTRDIEPQIGLDHSTVARRLAKPEVREYVERLHQDLIAGTLAEAVADIHYAVSQYRPQAALPAADRDSQLREHGFKAACKLAESVGILPAQANSILIQQIFAGQGLEVPDTVTRLFERLTHADSSVLPARSMLGDGQDDPLDI